MKKKCKNCKYYSQGEKMLGVYSGWCHRYPPIFKDEATDKHKCFVKTTEGCWCGEYRKKK